MKKSFLTLLALILCSLALTQQVSAQCPMCKLSAESNYNNGDDKATGLNTGILYLLCMPLIAVSSIGFYMWKKNKEELKALQEDSEAPHATTN